MHATVQTHSIDFNMDRTMEKHIDPSEATHKTHGPQFDDLFTQAYAELRRLAHGQRRRWSGDQTLNTTVLIHEAYLKLSQQSHVQFKDQGHFYGVAATAMRQILVNYAQMKRAKKRGGNQNILPLDHVMQLTHAGADEVLSVHQALTVLEKRHPRSARVFECRVFAGLTNLEIAESLGISVPTVKRDWQMASAIIYQQLSPSSDSLTV